MKNILFILSALVLFSCQKVIDINPATGDEKVIIQGYLFTDSIARVKITKSAAYLSTTPPPSIGTAVVTLSDGQGNTETLTWNAVKQYYESATTKGVANNTYTVAVTLEGKTYKSTSVLPDLTPADSITVPFLSANAFQKEGYYMELYATIPTNTKLYYLFKGYENDSLLDGVNSINYGNNDNLNGHLQGLQMGYKYEHVGDTAKLRIYSITQSAYNFYDAANQQLNNDGGFFSTPPANVPSMFDNGAIGLFQCSTIQVLKKLVVAQ